MHGDQAHHALVLDAPFAGKTFCLLPFIYDRIHSYKICIFVSLFVVVEVLIALKCPEDNVVNGVNGDVVDWEAAATQFIAHKGEAVLEAAYISIKPEIKL
jgi:hypothetical protein